MMVSPPSVLPVLLSVARAGGPRPAGLVSVWALAVLLPMVSGL
jgi:hypothetical protein